MPSSMPLGLNAAKVAQQGHIQQGQQQLLGGLGISASIQQQVVCLIFVDGDLNWLWEKSGHSFEVCNML